MKMKHTTNTYFPPTQNQTKQYRSLWILRPTDSKTLNSEVSEQQAGFHRMVFFILQSLFLTVFQFPSQRLGLPVPKQSSFIWVRRFVLWLDLNLCSQTGSGTFNKHVLKKRGKVFSITIMELSWFIPLTGNFSFIFHAAWQIQSGNFPGSESLWNPLGQLL